MDIAQDWATHLLGDHAPPYTQQYVHQLSNVLSTVKFYILPLIDQVSRKPDLATIALLLVIVLVSLKILDMLWQTVMFWVRLVRRVVFWAAIAVFAVWIYSRGPQGMMEDVQYWWQTWNQEHEYWKERERVARMTSQGRSYQGENGRARWV